MANIRFQNSLKNIPQNIPPVWMMRQAGRYHSHYRALREKYSFMELCKLPEIAAEVALGPIQEFDFDVAILFSDLLFPLEALGFGLEYTDAGPKLGMQLNEENINGLKKTEDALPSLLFQKEAVRLTREKIPQEKSLIGFVGGHWTLFAYAVAGRHEGGLLEAKKNLPLEKKFRNIILPLLKENIRLQLDGGAEIVMIFDTSAGELDLESFREIILPGVQELASAFPERIGYYSRGTSESHIKSAAKITELAGLGFDHRIDMTSMLSEKKKGFMQGNFDQSFLFQEKDVFKSTVQKYFSKLKDLSPEQRKGWVCGLGHGVLPKTPEYNVKYFVETVRETFS